MPFSQKHTNKVNLCNNALLLYETFDVSGLGGSDEGQPLEQDERLRESLFDYITSDESKESGNYEKFLEASEYVCKNSLARIICGWKLFLS